jgi:hypothetical protein
VAPAMIQRELPRMSPDSKPCRFRSSKRATFLNRRMASLAAAPTSRFDPVAHRLIERCDDVLILPGASTGADEDVRRARELGLPVFTRVLDVP